MTAPSSTPADPSLARSVFCWILFPLSLFPLVALLTYDWRAIVALHMPPLPTANWIGALGDRFAYYGYTFFGLAIWIIPLLSVIAAIYVIRKHALHSYGTPLWLFVFLVSISCLLQACSIHTTVLTTLAGRVNVANPGGAVGYLVMTRFLSPLLSDFGSAVIMVMVMAISLVAAIGFKNIGNGIRGLLHWAVEREATSAAESEATDAAADALQEQYRAIQEAKAAARETARAEKERIKAEKAAAKEAEKARRAAEKEAAAQQRAANVRPVAIAAEPVREPKQSQQDEIESDRGPYVLPPISLLNPIKKSEADHSDVGEMGRQLINTLKIFGIDAELAYNVLGPVVTKYALRLAPGIKYSAVTNISDNLMGALRARSLRIEAPIPGEDCVGIEVPNKTPAGISFREIIESAAWRGFKGELPLLFGKDAAGKDLVADLASMPHLLVAGATGQGKSVCLNSIINGLLMTKTPDQLKLIMVDPKSVEFTSYASLPHLIVPVITENKKVVFSLHWAVREMEKRLSLFARARVRNIYDFNHRVQFTQPDMFSDEQEVKSDMPRTVPYIVIIIDEVADLMSSNGKEVTPDIARLTAKARAAGIHLILATQRPDAKIITGTIKANIPGRVAFKTATAIDSRTILDDSGAENLIGRGDMLFKSKDGQLIRAQGAWISDPEIGNIIRFIEEHSSVQFDQQFTKKLGTIKEEEDDLFADPTEDDETSKANAAEMREQAKAEEYTEDFKKAIDCIISTNKASTSHFQRRLGWGYNHSARIMDMLEDAGVIGPQIGTGARQIIMDQANLLAILKGDDSQSDQTTDDASSFGAPDDGTVDQAISQKEGEII